MSAKSDIAQHIPPMAVRGYPLRGRELEAECLLSALLTAGCQAWLEGEKIRVAPTEKVPPDIIAELKEHKVELAKLLGGIESMVAVEHRIRRGADVLFAMEQQGQADSARYGRVFYHWTSLKAMYESRLGKDMNSWDGPAGQPEAVKEGVA